MEEKPTLQSRSDDEFRWTRQQLGTLEAVARKPDPENLNFGLIEVGGKEGDNDEGTLFDTVGVTRRGDITSRLEDVTNTNAS